MYRSDLTEAEKKELFLSLLSIRLGNVTEACRFTGIARQTYYDWLETDEEFKLNVALIHEEVKDFVEEQQLKVIGLGDGPSIRYWLNHRAKDRGYGQEKIPTPQQPPLILQQQINIGLPPEPKTLAEWETQVIEAREVRKLPEPMDQETVPELQETEHYSEPACIESNEQKSNETRSNEAAE